MHRHSAYAHEEPYLLISQDSLCEGRHPASVDKLITEQLLTRNSVSTKYKRQHQIAGEFKRQLQIWQIKNTSNFPVQNTKDSDTYSQLGEVVLDGPDQYYNHQRSQRCLMHKALMVPRNSRKHLELHIRLIILQYAIIKLEVNQLVYQFVHASIEG